MKMSINTYPEMNAKIVEFLRISDEAVDQYAAQRIEELESKVEEMQKTLEWAARIIDSGMGAGILRYDPLQWFIDYHTSLKGDTQ